MSGKNPGFPVQIWFGRNEKSEFWWFFRMDGRFESWANYRSEATKERNERRRRNALSVGVMYAGEKN